MDHASPGTSCKIQFQIVNSEDRQNVYFKRDGQRFGQEFTIKLKTETKYRCTMSLKPAIPLLSVSAHDALVNLVDQSKQDGSSTYEFEWPTTFPANKRSKRTNIPIVLRFQDGTTLSIPLQVKFYDAENLQHLNWGQQMHFIEYDCRLKECPDNNGMVIEKAQYY
uniref:CB1 cannabinoid receptor-interacting protein 1 n=1 Tax=Aceria tosichella TaxID=561515 RepID=A0A6G1S4Q9_9ACAR